MSRKPFATIAAVITIVAAFANGPSLAAESYPSRPISVIVPFPAGGVTDLVARIVAERMRIYLGQPLIIENVTGAGGTIAIGRAVRAAPDGYALITRKYDKPGIYLARVERTDGRGFTAVGRLKIVVEAAR